VVGAGATVPAADDGGVVVGATLLAVVGVAVLLVGPVPGALLLQPDIRTMPAAADDRARTTVGP
jgi:hypothetical protein